MSRHPNAVPPVGLPGSPRRLQPAPRERLTLSVSTAANVMGRVETLRPYFPGHTPDTVLALCTLRGLAALEREHQARVPLAAASWLESAEPPALDPDETDEPL
jgi:hypothetical protein